MLISFTKFIFRSLGVLLCLAISFYFLLFPIYVIDSRLGGYDVNNLRLAREGLPFISEKTEGNIVWMPAIGHKTGGANPWNRFLHYLYFPYLELDMFVWHRPMSARSEEFDYWFHNLDDSNVHPAWRENW